MSNHQFHDLPREALSERSRVLWPLTQLGHPQGTTERSANLCGHRSQIIQAGSDGLEGHPVVRIRHWWISQHRSRSAGSTPVHHGLRKDGTEGSAESRWHPKINRTKSRLKSAAVILRSKSRAGYRQTGPPPPSRGLLRLQPGYPLLNRSGVPCCVVLRGTPFCTGVCQRGCPGSPRIAPRSLQAATGRRSHPGATARTAVTPHP